MYLVQWEGLPFTNCSWEHPKNISVQFEPKEFDDKVPDFTGVPDDTVNHCLMLADQRTMPCSKVGPQNPDRERQLSLPQDNPQSKMPTPNTPPFQPEMPHTLPNPVFGTQIWKSYLPLQMISQVGKLVHQLQARFRAGIPEDGQGGIADVHLQCLLGQSWLSDYPINKLGTCLTETSTQYYDGARTIFYVPSYYSCHGVVILPGSHSNTRDAHIYMFAYNLGGLHWNVATYSYLLTCWLILDSIPQRISGYHHQVANCSNALVQLTQQVPNPNARVIVSRDWPEQPNGFDCGVYSCLALIFLAKNTQVGGLVDQMMEGSSVLLPSFPRNFIATMREELYCLSKLLAEPFTPHFVVSVS